MESYKHPLGLHTAIENIEDNWLHLTVLFKNVPNGQGRNLCWSGKMSQVTRMHKQAMAVCSWS